LDLFRNAIEVLHSRELALALRSTAHGAMGGGNGGNGGSN
jgi:hypothetical protein